MPYLAFNLNDGNEFVFDLFEDRLSIGRDTKNDIVIDNTFISGFHAEFLRQEDGGYEVIDLKSSNGTFVNGKRVVQARVRGGDKVSFGQLAARYKDDGRKTPAAKSSSGINGSSPKDGRRGDTESVPIPGPLTITPNASAVSEETGKVEPVTKVPLARPDPSAVKLPVPAQLTSTESKPLPPPRLPKPAAPSASDVDAAAARLAKMEREIVQSQGRAVSLRAEVEALEKRKSEIEAAFANVTTAKRELSALQGSIETARKLLTEVQAQGESARLQAETETKIEEGTQKRMDVLRGEITAAETTLNALNEAAVAKEAQVSALSIEEARIREEQMKFADAESIALQSNIETARKTLIDLQTQAEVARERAEIVATEEAGTRKKVDELRAQVTEAEIRIQALENEASGKQAQLVALGEAQRKLEEARANAAATEEQRVKLEIEVAELEQTRSAREEAAALAQKKHEDLTTQIAESESRAFALTQKLSELGERLKKKAEEETHFHTVSRSLAEACTQQEALVAAIATLAGDRQAKELDLELLTSRLTELKQAVSTTEDRLGALTAETATQEAKLAELTSSRGQMAEVTRSLAELELKKSQVESTIEFLNQDRERTEAESDELAKKLDAQRLELERLKKEGEAALVQAETIAEEEASARKKVEDLRVEIAQAEARIQVLGQEASGQRAQLAALADAQEKFKEAMANAEAAEAERVKLEVEVAELEQTRSARVDAANFAQKKHDALRTQIAESESRAVVLNQELSALEETLKKRAEDNIHFHTVSRSLTEASAQQEALVAAIAALAGERQAKESDLEALASRLTELKRAVSATEDQLGALAAETATQEAKLAELTASRNQMAEVTRSLAELELKKSQVESTIGILNQDRERTEAESGELAKKLDAQRLELESLQKGVESECARVQQFSIEREKTENHISELRHEAATLEGRVTDLGKTVQDAEARLTEAQAQNRSLSTQIDEGRTKLTRLHEEKATLEDVVNKLKSTQANADKAFSARQAEIDAILSAKGEELRLAESRQNELKLEEAVLLKRLDELAGTKDQLDEAGAALKALEDQRVQISSRLGEIKEQCEQRESELAQLSEAGVAQRLLLQTLGKQKSETEKQVAELQARHEATERHQKEIQSKFKEAKILCDAKEEAAKKAEARLQAFNAELAQTEEQRAHSVEQLGFLNSHIEEGKKILDDLANRSTEREQEAKIASARLLETQEQLKILQDQIDQANAALKEKQEALERVEETEAKLNTLKSDLADLGEKKLGAAVELEAVKNEANSARTELEVISKEIAEKRNAASAAEALFVQHDTGWREMQSKAIALQATVMQLVAQKGEHESEIQATEAEWVRKRAELETTASKIAILADEIAAKRSEKDQLGAQTQGLVEQTGRQEVELKQLIERGSAQRALIETLKTKRATFESDLKNLESQRTEVLGRIHHLEQSHASLFALLAADEERGRVLSAEVAELDQSKVELSKEIETARSDLLAIQAEIKKTTEEKSGKETALAFAHKALSVAQTDLEKTEAASEELKLQLASMKTEVEQRQDVIRRLVDQKGSFESELVALRASHGDMSQSLASTQSEVASANEALAALQAQSSLFEKSVAEQRAALDKDLDAKSKQLLGVEQELSQARAAIDQLGLTRSDLEAEVSAKSQQLTEIEKQLSDQVIKQADAEARLTSALNGLEETQSKRLAEEEALGNTINRQLQIKSEIETLRKAAEEEQAKVSALEIRAGQEVARADEAANHLARTTTQLEQIGLQKAEAEKILGALKTEEYGLQNRLPELNKELISVTAAVAALVSKRDETSTFLAQAQRDFDSGRLQMEALTIQISELQKQMSAEELRVRKAVARSEDAESRLSSTTARYETARGALDEITQRLESQQMLASQMEAKRAGLDEELTAHLSRLNQLKKEESDLDGSVADLREKTAALETEYMATQAKIRAAEAQFTEILQAGGRLMSMSEALTSVEQRQEETAKSLRRASEEELALQVKISTLLDNHNRELTRLEQIKKSRVAAEEESLTSADEIRKRISALEKAEAERAQQVSKVEARLGQLAGLEQKGAASVEALRSELAAMEARKGDFARAETKMRQWQEIEKRLQGQLAELEEKHEVMRMGLTTDESTVVMFATDLIKRLDLIDVLIQRFAEGGNEALGQQLCTLRASFEDILHQHGVTEFEVAAGTIVDVALRYKIAIVDSVPGKSKPKVIESYRPGYIYSSPEGRETILRKVEVKTSSL